MVRANPLSVIPPLKTHGENGLYVPSPMGIPSKKSPYLLYCAY